MRKFYNLLQSFFSFFNLKISRISSSKKYLFEAVLSLRNILNEDKLNDFELSFYNHLLENFKNSKSEKFQDLFVDWVMSSKKKGSFIEFGCCDGLYLSNTYFLEMYRDWNGILIEPSKFYHKSLKKNRSSCIIDFRCVHSVSGKDIHFSENKYLYNGKSNIKNLYNVRTVTINDIFYENNLRSLDFLSIDTDGTEYDIVKNFDFNKYKVKILVIEHNYQYFRKPIVDLLKKNNYINLFREISGHDDWFVLKEVFDNKCKQIFK
jgi:FkbM family methyltransferase